MLLFGLASALSRKTPPASARSATALAALASVALARSPAARALASLRTAASAAFALAWAASASSALASSPSIRDCSSLLTTAAVSSAFSPRISMRPNRISKSSLSLAEDLVDFFFQFFQFDGEADRRQHVGGDRLPGRRHRRPSGGQEPRANLVFGLLDHALGQKNHRHAVIDLPCIRAIRLCRWPVFDLHAGDGRVGDRRPADANAGLRRAIVAGQRHRHDREALYFLQVSWPLVRRRRDRRYGDAHGAIDRA